MRTNFVAAALVLAVPILTTDPATAQQTSSADFVEKVVISDMFEIRSGNLAADQAENDEVRSFGQKMVDDHKKTSDELRDLIEDEELKVDLPKELDQDHQAKLDNLKKLSGNKFDRAYVPMQVKAHEAAVDLFKNYAKNGDNDELKEWAEDTLPPFELNVQHNHVDGETGEFATCRNRVALWQHAEHIKPEVKKSC
jgi:putative membrane protein